MFRLCSCLSHIYNIYMYIYIYAYSEQNSLVLVLVWVHLSVFEFASINLALVHFTLTKGTGVPDNYILTCADKS